MHNNYRTIGPSNYPVSCQLLASVLSWAMFVHRANLRNRYWSESENQPLLFTGHQVQQRIYNIECRTTTPRNSGTSAVCHGKRGRPWTRVERVKAESTPRAEPPLLRLAQLRTVRALHRRRQPTTLHAGPWSSEPEAKLRTKPTASTVASPAPWQTWWTWRLPWMESAVG
jgi:hypothetical protein